MTKPAGSLQRVEQAATDLGLPIDIHVMDSSTRTAQEAADSAGCDVAQIVKSLIFERTDNGELVLVLVSGAHNASMEKLSGHFGTDLERANPRKIRNVTGFAIGGVSPIGHLTPLDTVMDETLLEHDVVWAAAGKPNAIFKVDTAQLTEAIGAKVISLV